MKGPSDINNLLGLKNKNNNTNTILIQIIMITVMKLKKQVQYIQELKELSQDKLPNLFVNKNREKNTVSLDFKFNKKKI